ncbi:MAG: hypothetical protein AAF763_00360 [Pseudomonadota bacterium]
MTVYVTKRPDETRDCAFEWTELKPAETLTEDLGWMIVPQSFEPDALTLTAAAQRAARSVATLTAGRAGRLYHVSNRVRTSLNRVLSRAVIVRVVSA